jgi:hypothetical protein
MTLHFIITVLADHAGGRSVICPMAGKEYKKRRGAHWSRYKSRREKTHSSAKKSSLSAVAKETV